MITTCLVFSFINCLLPDLRELCLFVLPEKICNSCTLDFEGQRAASVKLVSLLRPFVYLQGWALWTPFDPWVVFWSSFGILKKKKISLHVVCRLEVALFATLPAQSIREKEALSVPPSPPFWQTAKNSSGLPLVWDCTFPKAWSASFQA